MELLNDKITTRIKSDIIDRILQGDYDSSVSNISIILGQLHDNIPDNKRISYGIVHTIKILSEHLYNRLADADAPVLRISVAIFDESDDPNMKGDLRKIKGVGEKTADIILEILQTGTSSFYEQLLPG
jgi:hypothetical protein